MGKHQFSIANIPFGIASSPSHPNKGAATRLEDTVIFIDKLVENGVLSVSENIAATFREETLNSFAALPKTTQITTRNSLQELLTKGTDHIPESCKSHISTVVMHLPVQIGDFTDFSCSKEHVLNAGEAIMKKRFLPPGFLHFPIGYTGRTSSIIVSGSEIIRPSGQFRDGEKVVYGPTRQLDYELEVACIIGRPNARGEPVGVHEADEHIFGLVILNDWSARDIQGLEMNPLGPLNGKSFGTSISPWVVTLEALVSAAVPAPPKELEVAPYLQDSKQNIIYDLSLQAELVVQGAATTICQTNLKALYWNFRELVAHQTSNGCNLNTGDLLATGTVSGNSDDSHGCLLELTCGGGKDFELKSGEKRVYLEDGDGVRITGWTGHGVGFGECTGTVVHNR